MRKTETDATKSIHIMYRPKCYGNCGIKRKNNNLFKVRQAIRRINDNKICTQKYIQG